MQDSQRSSRCHRFRNCPKPTGSVEQRAETNWQLRLDFREYRSSFKMFDATRPSDGELDVDREIRIGRMRRELEELADGPMISDGLGNESPEIEELFLSHALSFEKAELDTPFNRLSQRGVMMEPPDELDETALKQRLSQVLRMLATMRCFLYQTDHLSDRELYQWLWNDGLREETPDMAELGGAWHTSPIGSCTDEDTAIYLKYYADEKDRERWREQFPVDPLPLPAKLPFDRDRNLPREESRGEEDLGGDESGSVSKSW